MPSNHLPEERHMAKKRKTIILDGPDAVSAVKKLSKKERQGIFWTAIYKDDQETVQALLKVKVDLNASGPVGLSPLNLGACRETFRFFDVSGT